MNTVYGIPTCGTVKKARAWLEKKDIPYQWVDFRQAPPNGSQIQAWVKAFGVKAMRNTSGGSYRALGSEKDSWVDEDWIDAFARDPMLIKRPVIERDGMPVLVGFGGDDAEILKKLGV